MDVKSLSVHQTDNWVQVLKPIQRKVTHAGDYRDLVQGQGWPLKMMSWFKFGHSDTAMEGLLH